MKYITDTDLSFTRYDIQLEVDRQSAHRISDDLLLQVVTKRGLKIGAGQVLPEIVPHPRPGSEQTLKTLLREFQRVNQDALERCVVIGIPAIVIENEHVFQPYTEPVSLIPNASHCNGVNCRRCEQVCPEGVFQLCGFFSLK